MNEQRQGTSTNQVSLVELIPSGVMGFYVRYWLRTFTEFDYVIQIHEGNLHVFRSNFFRYTGKITDTIFNIPNDKNIFNEFSRTSNTSIKWGGWIPETNYRATIRIDTSTATISEVQIVLRQAAAPTSISLCPKNQVSQRCSQLSSGIGLIRVFWDVSILPSISAGYGIAQPVAAYGIEYYRVEVFSTQSLNCMLVNQTCSKNTINSVCNFNNRIAIINSLPQLDKYYIRVVAGTIIGDGIYSSIFISNDSHINHKSFPVLEYPCVACNPGSFKIIYGMGSCMDCLEGKYQANFGSSHCQDCVAGKYSDMKGNNAEENCQECHMGKYQVELAAKLCIDCEAGKYNNLVGREGCKICPPNSQSKNPGSTICSCTKGYFGYGSMDCLSCPVGKYGKYEASMACTDCPRGKYLNAMGSIDELNCTMCLANSDTSVSGSKMCACNKGFSGLDVNGSCIKCSRGKYKTDFGSIQCTGCPRGKFLETSGSETELDCQKCPSNESISAVASARKASCTSATEVNYLITVNFNSNLDKSLISSEMLTNVIQKMSDQLYVDISRISIIPLEGNALKKNISFSITSVSQKESQYIGNDISLEMLNSILFSSSEMSWISTFLQVQIAPVIRPAHESTPMSILMFIIIGGGGIIILIFVVVVICLCKKKNANIKKLAHGTGYCVVCSGSYEEFGYHSSTMI